MKIRQGFISNSSSSSFIVGVGRIKDLEIFKKWLKKRKITEEDDLIIKTTSELTEEPHWSYDLSNNGLEVEANVNHCPRISLPIDFSKEDYYCIVNIGNDEGDSIFWDDVNEELDHDIDEDYFSGKQYDILKMLQESDLLEDTQYLFGAARNG